MAIISHTDTSMCRILLLRAHQAQESGSDIHLAANLTKSRIRMGKLAVALTRESPVVKRFIDSCIECRKHKASPKPYRMGPKQFVGDSNFGMSVFSHVNLDIIGYFYYATGKITRRNQAHKVWCLAIICLYSKALSLVLMQDYSSVSFKAAMSQHMWRYGRPSILTADNGSQIRKGAGEGEAIQTGQTMGALSEQGSSVVASDDAEPGIYNWCAGSRGFFKDTLIFLAPTEAQHRSGSIESHIRLVKSMLRSSMRRIRKQPLHPFGSIFELDLVLSKIAGLLNSRPIFSSKTGLTTISDVLQPRMSTAESFDIHEEDLTAKDELFKKVWQIFTEELVAGNLSKPGKISFTEDPSIKLNSVVMILYPSRNIWKYGRIEAIISKYRYKVQLKYGKKYQGYQIIDRSNLIVLFTPENNINQN